MNDPYVPSSTRGWWMNDSGLRNTCTPISQIPTAPFSYPTIHHSEQSCVFLFLVVYCEIWERCIVGFVRLVFCVHISMQGGKRPVFQHKRVTNDASRFWKTCSPVHKGDVWWRHQMETFSALMAICAGNSLVTGEFPTQRPVTRSFDVFFDLRLNKHLSKQSWGWWFETPSCPLWHHCNGLI